MNYIHGFVCLRLLSSSSTYSKFMTDSYFPSTVATFNQLSNEALAGYHSTSAGIDVVDFKCVLIGDKACGKTTLGQVFSLGERCFEVSKTFETIQTDIWLEPPRTTKCLKFNVQVHDIDEGDDYAHLRPQTYGDDTDIYLLCFSLTSPSSLDSITSKWHPEILKHHSSSKSKPLFLLVGLKRDEREQLTKLHPHNPALIDESRGHRVAKQIGACGYVECSALGGTYSTEMENTHTSHRNFSTAFRNQLYSSAFRNTQSPVDGREKQIKPISSDHYGNDGPKSAYAVFEMAFQNVLKRTSLRAIEKKRRQFSRQSVAFDSDPHRPAESRKFKCILQ